MAVYVDDMRARLGRMVMCHMIADTDDDLRAMANKIGVSQRWHQGDHFDICLSKRAMAVQYGAIDISRRELVSMIMQQRRTAAQSRSTG